MIYPVSRRRPRAVSTVHRDYLIIVSEDGQRKVTKIPGSGIIQLHCSHTDGGQAATHVAERGRPGSR